MRRTAAALVLAVAVQPPLFLLWIALPFLVTWSAFPTDQLPNMASFSLFAAAVAIPFVLIIGLPTAIWLDRIGKFRWKYFAAIGFFAAAIPMACFLPGTDSGYSSGGNFYGKPVDFIVDGVPTLYGWLNYVQGVVTFGLHGLAGATAFYLVARPHSQEGGLSGNEA
jgi:hypothetical protein